jgi:hypothetical protein
MAVAIEMDFAGATLDQYDQVIEKMGLTPRGESAPNSLFHWVAETDGGIKVVDVWESREAFDSFAEEQIGPFTAEVGISPPTMTFYEVHSYLTTPSG